MYDGTGIVPPTMYWISDAPAHRAPFYFDGITFDEFFVEMSNFNRNTRLLDRRGYKTIRQQLMDGDIDAIPIEYLGLCPDPDNCAAYNGLVKKPRKEHTEHKQHTVFSSATA